MISKAWRLLAKALGEKSGNTDKEANTIALIRVLLITQSIITNICIVLNMFRHWNAN